MDGWMGLCVYVLDRTAGSTFEEEEEEGCERERALVAFLA